MVAGVREKVGLGSGKERRFAAISLCQNDFVEKLNGGVVCSLALTLMNKFIEAFSVLAKYHEHVECGATNLAFAVEWPDTARSRWADSS